MNDLHVTSSITENSTSVIIESLGHGDTTGNGASLVDLLYHRGLTLNFTVLLNVICEILVGDEAGLSWVTVTAHGHSRALNSVVVTTSAVDRARLIRDLVHRHPDEGVQGIATMATVIHILT